MTQAATGAGPPRLWKAADLAAHLNISLRQLWRMRASDELPPPVRVGKRGVRWRDDDVARYVARLKVAR